MQAAVRQGRVPALQRQRAVLTPGSRTAPLHRTMPQLRSRTRHQCQGPGLGGAGLDAGTGTMPPSSGVDTATPAQPISEGAAAAAAAALQDRGDAIVVGAGPAGCVAAMFLSRQGFRVRVLERRSDPTAPDADMNRATFIMALMPRGINALKDLGVRLPEGKWMNGLAPAKGAVMHGLDGGKTLRPHPRGNVTVERNALAKHLLMEARRLHPGIDFQFDAAIEGFDLTSKTVSLGQHNGSSGAPQSLQYDLLVAADGSGSQVRDAVATQEPKFTASREMCDWDYMILRDLPPANVDPKDDRPGEFGRYVHMFMAKPVGGPDAAIKGFGAYMHEDGTYSAALQLERGFRPSAEADAMEAVLSDALPQAPKEWLKLAAKQTAGKQPRSWGSTVNCSHLAVPWAGVALVGDAGHGVTPNLGQGCNSALETVAVLDRVLAVNAKDLPFALAEYDRVRKPDMQALRYLDSISGRIWGGGKSKGLFDINWPFLGTLANIWVSGTLNKIVPRLWDPPAMLNGFTRKTTEYSYIVWCRRRDLAILACFCMAVIALGIEGVGWLVAA